MIDTISTIINQRKWFFQKKQQLKIKASHFTNLSVSLHSSVPFTNNHKKIIWGVKREVIKMQSLERNHWSDHDRQSGREDWGQAMSLIGGLMWSYKVEEVDASSNAKDHMLVLHRAFGSRICRVHWATIRVHQVWPKPSCKAEWKGGGRQGRQRKRWEDNPFIRSGQNHLARHSEREKKTRQTEKEGGGQQ